MTAALFSKTQARRSPTVSAAMAAGVTVIALVLGWVLMNGVMSRTVAVTQSGVTASAPAGWMLKYGLQGEELLFWTADQLDQNHRYIISIRPGIPKGTVTDVASTRTLEVGLNLMGYQIIDQSPAQVNGVEGYRVEFAFIKPFDHGLLPRVIRGVDYYIPKGDKVLVVSMENESEHFSPSLDAFYQFLSSVRYSAGG